MPIFTYNAISLKYNIITFIHPTNSIRVSLPGALEKMVVHNPDVTYGANKNGMGQACKTTNVNVFVHRMGELSGNLYRIVRRGFDFADVLQVKTIYTFKVTKKIY